MFFIQKASTVFSGCKMSSYFKDILFFRGRLQYHGKSYQVDSESLNYSVYLIQSTAHTYYINPVRNYELLLQARIQIKIPKLFKHNIIIHK